MDLTSPLTSSMPSIPLPPVAQRGSRDPAPSAQDFRSMLETEGVRPPKTAAEAKITAAQIADKAGVNARVKRDHVWTGMYTTPAAAPAVTPDRFMPLRQGPTAARVFNSSSGGGSAASVETLRATTKFAPGSVSNATQAVPAVAQSIKRTAAKAETETAVATASPPAAVEAYTYGLRAAAGDKTGDVPPWFSSEMQNALDKYDAMKTAAH
jgi:hypothetical protein